ncbi:MAG: hypothetical protein QM500_12945 [Methylococcales bacterium]
MTKKDEESEEIGYILIDAPVTQYSPKEEILAWIDTLKTYPDRPEVRREIKNAKEWLEY